jgi:hypothetical protein
MPELDAQPCPDVGVDVDARSRAHVPAPQQLDGVTVYSEPVEATAAADRPPLASRLA